MYKLCCTMSWRFIRILIKTNTGKNILQRVSQDSADQHGNAQHEDLAHFRTCPGGVVLTRSRMLVNWIGHWGTHRCGTSNGVAFTFNRRCYLIGWLTLWRPYPAESITHGHYSMETHALFRCRKRVNLQYWEEKKGRSRAEIKGKHSDLTGHIVWFYSVSAGL